MSHKKRYIQNTILFRVELRALIQRWHYMGNNINNSQEKYEIYRNGEFKQSLGSLIGRNASLEKTRGSEFVSLATVSF